MKYLLLLLLLPLAGSAQIQIQPRPYSDEDWGRVANVTADKTLRISGSEIRSWGNVKVDLNGIVLESDSCFSGGGTVTMFHMHFRFSANTIITCDTAYYNYKNKVATLKGKVIIDEEDKPQLVEDELKINFAFPQPKIVYE